MENRESTSYGWCPSELLLWIQQDPKKHFAFEIAMILIAGKFARILTDLFSIFLNFLSCFQELLFFWAWKSWKSINQLKALSKTSSFHFISSCDRVLPGLLFKTLEPLPRELPVQWQRESRI